MKYTITRFLLILAIFAGIVSTGPDSVSAQNFQAMPAPLCVGLTHGLYLGSRDSYWNNGEVTILQGFLQSHGYLSVSATGYFGPMTLRAVRNFQHDNGIAMTGFVGVLTRAQIGALCGTTIPPTGTLQIQTILPSAAAVGMVVTIYGSGFASNGNIIHFAGGAISNVSSYNGTSLTFTVPSSVGPYCAPGMMCAMYMQLITSGTYSVSVQNTNGTSNAVSFTVTDGTASQGISITGIDAPATLPLGSTGTWTVHATVGSYTSSNLHYSVNWGDVVTPVNSFAATGNVLIQNSTTFTHAYNQSGTYSPTFTVTDDSGRSATVSSTITVTPLTYNNGTPVTIYSISPAYGPVGTTVNITGFGFTSNNIVHFGGGLITNVPITSSIAIACTTNPACHGGINQTLTVVVPSSIGPTCIANQPCMMYATRLVTPGTYDIFVQSDNGTSNSVSYSVTQ